MSNISDEKIKDYMIKSQDQFNHACEIVKPFGQLDLVLDWCKNEMNGDWRWQLVDVSSPSAPGRYIFYVDDDRDYFAFKLRWS